jgi:trimeric autotransporter adhesin
MEMTHVLTTPSMIRLPSFAAAELEAYVKSNMHDGEHFGSSAALSGDTMVVGAPNEAGDSGAVYIFRRSSGAWGLEMSLKASNAESGDFFGSSVALSGDTLVVGAFGEASKARGINGDQSDNSAEGSGAVYVFRWVNGGWRQEAYVKASNTWPDVDAGFGASVALSGDTFVVGAPAERSNATGINGDQRNRSIADVGAVYVFRRSGGVWRQEAYVKASNVAIDALFGSSVALNDNTMVVGAPNEKSNATGINGDQSDLSAPDSGAVYVFQRSGVVWRQKAYVKASNTGVGDSFGGSVALSGDTMVVGAPNEASNIVTDPSDDSGASNGAVYIFNRTSGVWSQEKYLKASDTRPSDFFGNSVALSNGDISGITLAVSAPMSSSASAPPNPGAVYVFRRPSGFVTQTIPPSTPISREWKQQIIEQASNAGDGDGFGSSVALSNDTLVVGAPEEDSEAKGISLTPSSDDMAKSSGAVYVYRATK